MDERSIDIPSEWIKLEIENLQGTLLVIGATNTGKTTFARYLYRRLVNDGHTAGYIDGDIGQSTLGPPGTMTLVVERHKGPPSKRSSPKLQRQFFVGAVSPRGHMLPLLVGAGRLAQEAFQAGAQVLVYDTTGLVDPGQGGLALKLAKLDLLQPTTVFGIQQDKELEPVLKPLRRTRRTRLVELHPSMAVHRRDSQARKAHRAAQFEKYFAGASLQTFPWRGLAVFPAPSFRLNRLVGFEDRAGFTLALGIVQDIHRQEHQVTCLTPLKEFERVDALRLGDLYVDPHSFQDEQIGY